METKKIRVVHSISRLETGGAQAVLYQILHGLNEPQFEHHVLYFYDGPYLQKIQQLGVKTYHIKGLLFPYDPVFLYRLYATIKTLKPDCLHTVLWAANFLGKIIGKILSVPVVQVLHNSVDYNGFLCNSIDRFITFQPACSVAFSDSVKASFLKKAPWVKSQKMNVIKNGIDADVIKDCAVKEAKTRKSLGLLKKHFVIGTVGRFESAKNYGLLLTSFALLYDDYPHARLVLVGEGKQERFLRQRALDLGIEERVIFVIGQSSSGYYPLFDCFVQSSFFEGLSMALLEASVLAVPSVVTLNEGVHDLIVDGQNGQLVPSGDAYALTRALVFYIKYPAKRKLMGCKVQKDVITYFKSESMVLSYARLYNQLVGQKRA